MICPLTNYHCEMDGCVLYPTDCPEARRRKQMENPDPVCADCGSDLDGEGRCKRGCEKGAR